MSEINANTLVTISEACACLNMEAGDLNFLISGGPFTPVNGFLTLRQVLGCKVTFALQVAGGADLIPIGIEAAAAAQLDAARVVLIAWGKQGSAACWCNDPAALGTILDGVLQLPTMAVPIDRMFANLAAGLATHRASSQRLN